MPVNGRAKLYQSMAEHFEAMAANLFGIEDRPLLPLWKFLLHEIAQALAIGNGRIEISAEDLAQIAQATRFRPNQGQPFAARSAEDNLRAFRFDAQALAQPIGDLG